MMHLLLFRSMSRRTRESKYPRRKVENNNVPKSPTLGAYPPCIRSMNTLASSKRDADKLLLIKPFMGTPKMKGKINSKIRRLVPTKIYQGCPVIAVKFLKTPESWDQKSLCHQLDKCFNTNASKQGSDSPNSMQVEHDKPFLEFKNVFVILS